ncbi:MAG: toll/interleukin-1 receptor domain-containing protein [Terricaulis sp.]
MEEVFLSYKREDISRAKAVADGLKAEGLRVFFDAGLKIGERWDEGLETRLNEMPAVAVLWSKKSRKSDMVCSEAARGLSLRKLVPATIEACTIPLGFDRIQTADLRNWRTGDFKHFEWRRFTDALLELAGRQKVEELAPRSPSPFLQHQPLPPAARPANGDSWTEFKHSTLSLADQSVAELASYRFSASRGEVWAQYMLGVMLLLGYGVERNEIEAIACLRFAADRGWSAASYALGVAYENGVGQKIQLKKALACYRKAARAGHQAALQHVLRLEFQGAA